MTAATASPMALIPTYNIKPQTVYPKLPRPSFKKYVQDARKEKLQRQVERERAQKIIDERLEKESNEVFQKYADLEKKEYEMRIQKFEKASQKISSKDISSLYKPEELSNMQDEHKMKMASVFGRLSRKTIRT